MNPQGKLKFQTIEEFLDFISDEEREIVDAIRCLIMDEDDTITEKLAYNVPFYYRNNRLFYLWPGSIPWGGIDDGVTFGFLRGALLEDPLMLFRKSNHVSLRNIDFKRVDSINQVALSRYIRSALEIDDII